MDSLHKESDVLSENRIMDFVESNVPDFRSYSDANRLILIERVKNYLQTKEISAQTFEEYGLRGTPSCILIDRKGIVRHISFGADGLMDKMVQDLVIEQE